MRVPLLCGETWREAAKRNWGLSASWSRQLHRERRVALRQPSDVHAASLESVSDVDVPLAAISARQPSALRATKPLYLQYEYIYIHVHVRNTCNMLWVRVPILPCSYSWLLSVLVRVHVRMCTCNVRVHTRYILSRCNVNVHVIDLSLLFLYYRVVMDPPTYKYAYA